jgi:hypothetical protein
MIVSIRYFINYPVLQNKDKERYEKAWGMGHGVWSVEHGHGAWSRGHGGWNVEYVV